MSWDHPYLAALAPALAIACLIAGAAVARAARRGARPVGAGEARLTASVSRRRERLRDGLMCAGLALVLVALAGPRWGVARGERLTHGCDAALLIDCSRSMLATDAYPTRSAAARRKAVDLLEAAPQMRIALMPFARVPMLRCPFTGDQAALEQMIGGCAPSLFPAADGLQGTDIAAAVRSALRACENGRSRGAAIIVLSDGGDDDDPALAHAGEEAAQAGVPIYSILLGDPAHAATLQIDGASREVGASPAPLARLADATGGRCWPATSGAEDVHQLADAIDGALRGGTWRRSADATAAERYRIPLALGMGALLLGAMLPTRRRAHGIVAGLARAAAAAALLLGLSPSIAAVEADADAVARALALPPDKARAALAAELIAHPDDRIALYDLGTLLIADDPHAAVDALDASIVGAARAHDAQLMDRALANRALAQALQGQLESARAGLADLKQAEGDHGQAVVRALEREAAERKRAGVVQQPDQVAVSVMPPAMVGRHYTRTIEHPREATLTPAGPLPAGWSVDAQGALVGDPREEGLVALDIRATTASSRQLTRYLVRVLPRASVRTGRLPPAIVGMPYREAIRSQGLGWAAWSADGLPNGLDVASDQDQADLAWVVGTPLATGVKHVTVRAHAGALAIESTVDLTVVSALAVATLELPQATMGAAYRARLSLRGPDRDYAWSAPPTGGLVVAAGGEVSGMPTAEGELSLPVTLRGGELQADATVTIRIAPWPAIMVPPTLELPARRPIALTLAESGGTPPLAWSLGSGALPSGLTLGADGTLIGACARSGRTQARLRCVDRWGATAERTIDLVVVDTASSERQQQQNQQASRQQQKDQQPSQPQQQSPDQHAQQQQSSQQAERPSEAQPQSQRQQGPQAPQEQGQPRSLSDQRDAPQQASQQPHQAGAQHEGHGSGVADAPGSESDRHGEDEADAPPRRAQKAQERDARRWLASLPDEDEAALRDDLRQQPPASSGKPPW